MPVFFNKQNGNFFSRQVPVEEEQHLVIAVHSRSSIEAVVTTVVPGFVTVGHGALWRQTMIETRSGATVQVCAELISIVFKIRLNHAISNSSLFWTQTHFPSIYLSVRVVQGYSRDAWLADFIFRETWLLEIIHRDSWTEGFAWPAKNLNY